jgi:hypothetical protein
MKAKPLEIEPKGWGDNAPMVTFVNLQQKERESTKMSLSTQRHRILYKFEEISHMYQKT